MQKQDLLKEKENKLAGLFDEYYDRITRYAYARIGDMREAEDIASEVFVKALKSLGTYEERGLAMGAWLFKIAHNLVVDFHRSRGERKQVDVESIEIESASKPEMETEQKLEIERVRQAMAALSQEQREILELRFFGGISSADVGKMLGKSDGAVREAQSAALKKLRIKLI
jgi:RNA polymerase sigma-70 factor, ECF subfamily